MKTFASRLSTLMWTPPLSIFAVFVLLMALPDGAHAQGQRQSPAPGRPYAEVIPPSAETERGLFHVHRVGSRWYFEIPEPILGREMALLSRMAAMPTGIGVDMLPGGDRLNETQFMNYDTQVIRWEREGARILLRGVSHAKTAAPGDPIARALEHIGFEPIIASIPIEAVGPGGSVVIDVTGLYTTGNPNFGLDASRRTQWGARRVDEDRSYLRMVRAFPTNVEVRNVLTYEADAPPALPRTGALSILAHHSMILLPDEPMRPRLHDPRVEMITVETLDYSTDRHWPERREYVQRFRLEPSDPAAMARGELVDPVKPIVWYIDPATPERWRSYVKEGLEEWNAAFEQAGFRNAVRAIMAPEDDPGFDLMDARFNVVRWIATPELSANAGPDVVDPRSGETIRAHMNMYDGIAKRLHWWSLTQTGPRNPAVQALQVPDEEMGEYIRYVVSHEMGHALGYPHNQLANAAFPVDSLRSPDFTRRMGNSGSVVGRTRFNYVAQPEDGDVLVHRAVGEYDKWAVAWAYRPILEAATADEERPILDRWIRERAHDPLYRFGAGNDFDPYQQTESIGREWIEASELGMRNLRAVVPNLIAWIGEEGDTWNEVMERYMQVHAQWGRFITRVITAVGGLTEQRKAVGEEGPVYTPIAAADQARSMDWLHAHVFETPEWLLDVELLRRFEPAGAVERVRWYQVTALNDLLGVERLERLIEQQALQASEGWSLAEMLDALRGGLWRELAAGEAIDPFRRNLQRGYLDRMEALFTLRVPTPPPPPGDYRPELNTPGLDDVRLRTPFMVQQSDIPPLVREQLQLLAEEVERALARPAAGDRETRAHLRDVRARLGAMGF
jgi:hypothetical protein